jgi:hypothetical protein
MPQPAILDLPVASQQDKALPQPTFAKAEISMNKYIFFFGMACLFTGIFGHLIIAFVLTG